MREIILNLATTLDGLIEGANGEVDWCILEEEMHAPGNEKHIKQITGTFYFFSNCLSMIIVQFEVALSRKWMKD